MKSVSGESGQLITASKFYQELMKSSGSGESGQLITALEVFKALWRSFLCNIWNNSRFWKASIVKDCRPEIHKKKCHLINPGTKKILPNTRANTVGYHGVPISSSRGCALLSTLGSAHTLSHDFCGRCMQQCTATTSSSSQNDSVLLWQIQTSNQKTSLYRIKNFSSKCMHFYWTFAHP